MTELDRTALVREGIPRSAETPHQEPTVETTTEQVDLAKAMHRAVADMLAEDIDRSVVADRIEQVAAGLVASLRAQTRPRPSAEHGQR